MTKTEIEQIVSKHFNDLHSSYDELRLSKNSNDDWIVSGKLRFIAVSGDDEVEDEFSIEISLPSDYPETVPIVKEVGGRIPMEFHTNPDGSLCLLAPLEVKRKFAKQPTLIGFVNNLLIPYLYSFNCYSKSGQMPFGELSHGGKGILEYYQDLFQVDDDISVLGLLRIMADDNYRGHQLCPCGSGKKLRQCHGDQLIKIKDLHTATDFRNEYGSILFLVLNSGKKNLPESVKSKTFMNELRKKIESDSVARNGVQPDE